MKSTLLIFIDGLQFDSAVRNLKVLNKAKTSKLTPGIGFSNNIYPEMLCGTNPDQIGYFNEWSPVKGKSAYLPWYLRILDIFRFSVYINAGIRKIILNKLFKKNFSNIPFKYVHFFSPQGSHNFRDLEGNNLLHKKNFIIFDAAESPLGLGKKDNFTFEKIDSFIQNRNYLISLVDLDNIAHVYGTKSQNYKNHLNFLDLKINNLIKSFRLTNPDNQIFLFSDHGMVDVKSCIDFNIEKKFGPMDCDKYLYFIDSTYLRVWSRDTKFLSKIEDYLLEKDFGEIINEKERKELVFPIKSLETLYLEQMRV